MLKKLFLASFFLLTLFSCKKKSENIFSKSNTENVNANRSKEIMDSIYAYYSLPNTALLRENYPFQEDYKASYTLSNDNGANPYSYLWPYSGTLSAGVALYGTTKDKGSLDIIEERILPGLEEYYDNKREPYAYSSYINSAPESDRFYDDNIWIGIDFTDLYLLTHDKRYLAKAKEIWNFIESGRDDKLGGDGIYWCEASKTSKNTCSNAPAVVYALKLFEATGDSIYFKSAENLYDWTKNNLQDKDDFLYYDNINLEGKVDKHKYPYNSGQMLQAAAMLYKLSNDSVYYNDAKNIADSGKNYFFEEIIGPDGNKKSRLKENDVWFIAIMMRGYLELYEVDHNNLYLLDFKDNLDNAWENMRTKEGLFNVDWSNQKKKDKHWLLTQAAFAEMFANLNKLENAK